MALLRALWKLIDIILAGVLCFVLLVIITHSTSWAGWFFWIGILIATLAVFTDYEREVHSNASEWSVAPDDHHQIKG